MKKQPTNNSTKPSLIPTEEYARQRLVKADTVRRRLCTHGSYFGDVPTKLINGRLGWPDKPVAVEVY